MLKILFSFPRHFSPLEYHSIIGHMTFINYVRMKYVLEANSIEINKSLRVHTDICLLCFGKRDLFHIGSWLETVPRVQIKHSLNLFDQAGRCSM